MKFAPVTTVASIRAAYVNAPDNSATIPSLAPSNRSSYDLPNLGGGAVDVENAYRLPLGPPMAHRLESTAVTMCEWGMASPAA
jgi:hypothetical protein